MSTFVKYVLHTIDLQSEAPWEDKSVCIFYLELVVDFLKLLTYISFFTAVVHFYGLPLHIVRDLYLTLRSFIQRLRDLVKYRQATFNMNDKYPNATEAELEDSDRVCIICREEMTVVVRIAGVVDPIAPKKLPCGHIFHFRCLRSWLERQQACPTCRRGVLEPPIGKFTLF